MRLHTHKPPPRNGPHRPAETRRIRSAAEIEALEAREITEPRRKNLPNVNDRERVIGAVRMPPDIAPAAEAAYGARDSAFER